MPTPKLLIEIPKIICRLLPGIAAIYSFGSLGSKFERTESDVDLAILGVKKLTTAEKFAVQEEIARLIHRDVDLIDLSQASTVLRFQIVSTGKLIFCQNKQACDLFEMLVYSTYVRFNDERREILDDIKKRGRIFNG